MSKYSRDVNVFQTEIKPAYVEALATFAPFRRLVEKHYPIKSKMRRQVSRLVKVLMNINELVTIEREDYDDEAEEREPEEQDAGSDIDEESSDED